MKSLCTPVLVVLRRVCGGRYELLQQRAELDMCSGARPTRTALFPPSSGLSPLPRALAHSTGPCWLAQICQDSARHPGLNNKAAFTSKGRAPGSRRAMKKFWTAAGQVLSGASLGQALQTHLWWENGEDLFFSRCRLLFCLPLSVPSVCS